MKDFVAKDKTYIANMDVPLERDMFFRTMLRTLTGTLETIIGLPEAEGYMRVVGAEMGDAIGKAYLEGLGQDRLRPDQLAAVLTDLKARIGGDFEVVAVHPDRIVFSNSRCPFGAMVDGRKSLCQMTSNVFGRIAADTHGYARIEQLATIAEGHGHCHVVVHLRHDPDGEGTSYFRTGE